MRKLFLTLQAGVLGAAVYGWFDLGKPFGSHGLEGFLGAGLVFAVLLPVLLTSALHLPLLLIPSRMVRKHRARKEYRPNIPALLRKMVHVADRYRCVWCRSKHELQIDHAKPYSAGGLTVWWNLLTLCKTCNMIKSNCWVAEDGYVFYRAWAGHSDKREALRILAYEKRHRWSPLRWIRAALVLG